MVECVLAKLLLLSFFYLLFVLRIQSALFTLYKCDGKTANIGSIVCKYRLFLACSKNLLPINIYTPGFSRQKVSRKKTTRVVLPERTPPSSNTSVKSSFLRRRNPSFCFGVLLKIISFLLFTVSILFILYQNFLLFF